MLSGGLAGVSRDIPADPNLVASLIVVGLAIAAISGVLLGLGRRCPGVLAALPLAGIAPVFLALAGVGTSWLCLVSPALLVAAGLQQIAGNAGERATSQPALALATLSAIAGVGVLMPVPPWMVSPLLTAALASVLLCAYAGATAGRHSVSMATTFRPEVALSGLIVGAAITASTLLLIDYAGLGWAAAASAASITTAAAAVGLWLPRSARAWPAAVAVVAAAAAPALMIPAARALRTMEAVTGGAWPAEFPALLTVGVLAGPAIIAATYLARRPGGIDVRCSGALMPASQLAGATASFWLLYPAGGLSSVLTVILAGLVALAAVRGLARTAVTALLVGVYAIITWPALDIAAGHQSSGALKRYGQVDVGMAMTVLSQRSGAHATHLVTEIEKIDVRSAGKTVASVERGGTSRPEVLAGVAAIAHLDADSRAFVGPVASGAAARLILSRTSNLTAADSDPNAAWVIASLADANGDLAQRDGWEIVGGDVREVLAQSPGRYDLIFLPALSLQEGSRQSPLSNATIDLISNRLTDQGRLVLLVNAAPSATNSSALAQQLPRNFKACTVLVMGPAKSAIVCDRRRRDLQGPAVLEEGLSSDLRAALARGAIPDDLLDRLSAGPLGARSDASLPAVEACVTQSRFARATSCVQRLLPTACGRDYARLIAADALNRSDPLRAGGWMEAISLRDEGYPAVATQLLADLARDPLVADHDRILSLNALEATTGMSRATRALRRELLLHDSLVEVSRSISHHRQSGFIPACPEGQ
ncbi:hypothetical protein CKO28_09025 [Rhodovibrio sodomensis]|uniref:PABS domain-containing protein n=2 Tax=Rhodovibrio sodomensis TaxID=1088 RepID=A0ABS1DF72_9PROT|nr:hypothetical protein [Rhodovibrio sodomensis]